MKKKDTDREELTKAIVTIIESPHTPTKLYDAIGDFIADATTIKDSQGESLLDRWTSRPETIAACVEWANEEDHRTEDAQALLGRRNGGA